MERSLLASQWKKLAVIAALLVGVAVLIGGEDNPGVLASTADGSADTGIASAPVPPAQGTMPPAPQGMAPPAPLPASLPAPALAQTPVPSPTETVAVTGDALIDKAQGVDPAPMLDPTPVN